MDDDIVQLSNQGKSVQSIAKTLHVSKHKVYATLKRNNISCKTRKVVVADAPEEEIQKSSKKTRLFELTPNNRIEDSKCFDDDDGTEKLFEHDGTAVDGDVAGLLDVDNIQKEVEEKRLHDLEAMLEDQRVQRLHQIQKEELKESKKQDKKKKIHKPALKDEKEEEELDEDEKTKRNASLPPSVPIWTTFPDFWPKSSWASRWKSRQSISLSSRR